MQRKICWQWNSYPDGCWFGTFAGYCHIIVLSTVLNLSCFSDDSINGYIKLTSKIFLDEVVWHAYCFGVCQTGCSAGSAENWHLIFEISVQSIILDWICPSVSAYVQRQSEQSRHYSKVSFPFAARTWCSQNRRLTFSWINTLNYSLECGEGNDTKQ